ncbi:MAG: WD40 domain-containing protein [Candidatus Bipolaricaulota bacterium]|nr:WD40 domain-containing protein [Candidatus Bipolaricaulota bacterium]
MTPISGFGAPVVQGVLSLAFSPDGRFLAAAASSGRVHVWEVGPR